MTIDRLFTFSGGNAGAWRVDRASTLVGDPLPDVSHADVLPGRAERPVASWNLHGIVSNERYVVRDEKTALVERQQGLGRRTAVHAALIPIRKSAAWWALTQDERRSIFEDQSRHIAIGMSALPGVARRLHHCRDLGWTEPFDFLTWFEFASEHGSQFDELVGELRASPEWHFVDREIDIRLVRDDDGPSPC